MAGREDLHLMISYQWDSKKRMLKLRDGLKQAGYNVWMDVDKMEGNMDDRMSEAVEQASVVLVCFSKKYQESANCKKEAQYADNRKKHIIPLKYEEHDPTGWLGILINKLIYYDVTSDAALESNLPNIIRALDNRGVAKSFCSKSSTSESITTSKSMSESSEPPRPIQGCTSGFSIINRDDVTFGGELGGGGFGTVYLARHKHWGDVAVKQFKSLVSEDVRREAEKMWRAISSTYMVRIMGVIDDPKHLSIVMEHFKNGNLKDFRRQYMESNDTMARKVHMMVDIALGMNYLHTLTPPILHRDLKLSNIFVGNAFEAKIGDLGLAINVTADTSSGNAGTCTHLPPEAWAKDSDIKEPFDVYTFGITLSEFLNGSEPWPFSSTAPQIKKWVLDGKRPELSDKVAKTTPTEIIELMRHCWHQKPHLRPTFQDIMKRLSVLYDERLSSQIDEADDVIRAEQRKARGGSGKTPGKLTGATGVAGSGARPRAGPISDSGVGLSAESFADKLHLDQPAHLMQSVKEFGHEGGDELERARGVAVSATGDVFIADTDRKQVLLYTIEGKLKTTLKSPGGVLEGQLRIPQDVAITEDGGCLMVADMTKFVKVFDADGSYLQSFATREKGSADKRIGVCCLDIDSQGQIVVGNQKSQVITVHDVFDGSMVKSIDVGINPCFLAVNRKDQIIIGDYSAMKVTAIDYTGKQLFTINPQEDCGAPCKPLGITCNAKDEIFVAVIGLDSAGNDAPDSGRILRYTNTGLFLSCVAKDLYYPMGIKFTQDGKLLMVANYMSVLVLGQK